MRFAANEKYTQALLDTLVHIQTHLDDDLSLDHLAERAAFSVYHFHRIFSEFVGEPPKEYIRRLRLERSTFRLRITDATILDIALECGFKTHETYTRAFKRHFKISPSAFRANHLRAMQRRMREVHYADAQVQLNEIDRLAGESKEVKVRVERVRPIKVAFVRHLGAYESVLEPGRDTSCRSTPASGEFESEETAGAAPNRITTRKQISAIINLTAKPFTINMRTRYHNHMEYAAMIFRSCMSLFDPANPISFQKIRMASEAAFRLLSSVSPAWFMRVVSGQVGGQPFHFRNRSALPMTTRSETPIAAAQRTGLRKPRAASGTAAAL